MAKLATVDIEVIEREIRGKTEAIEALTREKEILEGMLLYAAKPLNGHKASKGKRPRPRKYTKAAKPIKQSRKRPSGKMRISEYLTDLVSSREIATRDAVQTYADYMETTYAAVYNSVNNALNRLKEADRVAFTMDADGNRVWRAK